MPSQENGQQQPTISLDEEQIIKHLQSQIGQLAAEKATLQAQLQQLVQRVFSLQQQIEMMDESAQTEHTVPSEPEVPVQPKDFTPEIVQ